MPISEPADQECSLADLPRGVAATVVGVDAPFASQLAAHGLHAGSPLRIDDDAPFGGPRIVRLGVARVALARPVTRAVRVRVAVAEIGAAAEEAPP
jgi:Fe2+ transport system protein FeoA